MKTFEKKWFVRLSAVESGTVHLMRRRFYTLRGAEKQAEAVRSHGFPAEAVHLDMLSKML